MSTTAGTADWAQVCTLWLHDDALSTQGVVFNPEHFASNTLTAGRPARIIALKATVNVQDFSKTEAKKPDDAKAADTKAATHDIPLESGATAASGGTKRERRRKGDPDYNLDNLDFGKALVFAGTVASSDQLAKHPNLVISVHKDTASVFGFRNRTQVLVCAADEDVHTASHVELAFKDEYLARADMWRMAISELTLKSVYKGQKLLFLGTIKATVRSIYVKGKRVSSAYFSADTKPIFRSESARYVIFIQMSREMWDFDAEGSGEIMFNKVVNGFLPDLFKRWERLQVRHLLSLVMFTRMEYDRGVLVNPEKSGSRHPQHRRGLGGNDFRDYYRVVTTDSASADWVKILNRLKREFNSFLRDVSTLPKSEVRYLRPSSVPMEEEALPPGDAPLIAGTLSTASRGNILEAINLASSQFSKDYIDRDLVRTGVSVVIVTAGTGVFEVDYNMLKLTSDTLVGSGIGIDLVALGGMPLHSVPLFAYRTPLVAGKPTSIPAEHSFGLVSTPRQAGHFPASFSTTSLRGGHHSSQPRSEYQGANISTKDLNDDAKWSYALPHWIDVSFWTGESNELSNRMLQESANDRVKAHSGRRRGFKTTCRMYELQMMGLMENEMSDIFVPFLHERASQPHRMNTTNKKPWLGPEAVDNLGDVSLATSFNSSYSAGFMDGSPRKDSEDIGEHLDATIRQPLRDWMKEYDRRAFAGSDTAQDGVVLDRKRSLLGKSKTDLNEPSYTDNKHYATPLSQSPRKITSFEQRASPGSLARTNDRSISEEQSPSTSPKKTYREDEGSLLIADAPKRQALPRQISLGPRGFGTVKSIASIKVDAEHAETSRPIDNETIPAKQTTYAKPTSMLASLLQSFQRKPSQAISDSASVSQKSGATNTEESQASDPISIRNGPIENKGKENGHDTGTVRRIPQQSPDRDVVPELNTFRSTFKTPKNPADLMVKDASTVGRQTGPPSNLATSGDQREGMRELSPLNALSPWLTMLNPSNPRKENMSIASQFRRWHHVFPKAIPTSAIKWKSLCSPAALPLTNEHFPTPEQLRTEYYENPYVLQPFERDDLAEAPRAREMLLRELISYRLSHGFQVIIGEDADRYVGSSAASLARIFDKDFVAEDGATILMSVGTAIHQLLCVGGEEVQVKRFKRKPMAAVESTGLIDPAMPYTPFVRSAYATEYETRNIRFKPSRQEYDWNRIDHFLAGYQDELTKDMPYWRARFVLIPVEPPKGNRRALSVVAEDTDEEIRLEGIQKLTQTWQRHRYVPPDERRFHMSLQKQRKDLNPLAIEYQTNDPAACARAFALGHADNLVAGDVAAAPQLFAEAELYHSNDFDMQRLAQDMQADPPKGITVVDRRWHLKLHYRCFRGDELTSWLLSRFKDIHSRDEAVRLGNILMKKGLFTHVQSKHQFRDGNYFYQIAPEYRKTAHPDSSVGWWPGGKSVPSTPLLESTRGSPLPERSRSRSGTEQSDESITENATRRSMNGKPKLELTHMLRYNVDHRGKSDRPEILNLHYDRIHNPDSCYHIRIDWMNTTAKLIEDAIVQWATLVERYGLKLVEVPLAEASMITKHHPFRAPYLVKLAVPPPVSKPHNYFESPSFAPHPHEERHAYQKALLRKFDFVLDRESVEDFEESGADVWYSWGKPDYRMIQYIHKSGLLLIQINPDGNFLCVKNGLCGNRAASAKDASKFDKVDRQDRQERRFMVHTAARMDRPSPYSSPLVRAVTDTAVRGLSRNTGDSSPAPDPDDIVLAFEKFCQDGAALQEFYKHAFKTAASPGLRHLPVANSDIPTLGLPPSNFRSVSHGPITLSQARNAQPAGSRSLSSQTSKSTTD
ncbi:vacuolar membrane-associated protein iml1 [Zalaria obscura]|uniref:Vacuolar membrane-associated protein iml1 n=1 Tax=Zalaria obscura TaxID=2024903 RepID=A0ACC3SET3_9PEZI